MNDTFKRSAFSIRYLSEFGGTMILYIFVLLCSVSYRGSITHPTGAFLLEISPVIPALLSFWAIIRQYKRMDEWWQKVQSEAWACSGIVTALGTFAYGFMENAGLSQLPTIWVMPIMVMLWGVMVPVIIRRKYS